MVIHNIFLRSKAKYIKIVILCFTLGLTSTLLYSQSFAFVKVTAGNLRDNPNGNEIMQLPYGTKLKIINATNSWYKVEINIDSIQGFIHKSIISLDSLFERNYNNEKKYELELTGGGFEDKHIIRAHTIPCNCYDDIIRPVNEQFEQLLYWGNYELSAKHYIYNMDIMVERTRRNTYYNTPCEIFNQSKIYCLSKQTYNNEQVTRPTHREFEKPIIKKSYFSIKPDNYLISKLAERQDSLFFGNYFALPKLIHLLRIYFKEENTFKLYKNKDAYIYTSLKRIRFFTTDEKGENIIENTGVLTYLPGQRSRICITNLEIPYNQNMIYIYFSDEEIIDKHLQNKINITATKKSINEWFEFEVFEFDFDCDGVVDLLRSFEFCPDEAGDSHDEVYYFNENGKWRSMLATRTWCNP